MTRRRRKPGHDFIHRSTLLGQFCAQLPADATEVTAEQAKAADGLVGHRKDGVVDKVEAAALVQASRWSYAATSTSDGLAKLLATGRSNIDRRLRTPARFPDYITADSLSIAADMDNPPHPVARRQREQDGEVWLGDNGVINAAFAQGVQTARRHKLSALNAAEQALAARPSRSLLKRLACAKPSPRPAPLYARAALAATLPAAADEHDLSVVAMVPWLVSDSSEARTTVMQLDDQTTAFHHDARRFRSAIASAMARDARDRHLTTGEVATRTMSREISDATDALPRAAIERCSSEPSGVRR